MVSVCLPSDALLQHLPSYLSFSYLGRGVPLHGCSSKAQLLLLPLDEGYLLTATLPDLQHGIALLALPTLVQPPLLRLFLPATAPASGMRWLLPATPDLRRGVAPLGRRPWPQMRGVSSWPPLTSDLGSSSRLFLRRGSLALSAAASDLGHGVTPLGRGA